MDKQPLELVDLFTAIEQGIVAALPGFETVAMWPDIRDRVRLPALILELAGMEPGRDDGTGKVALLARFEAYVVVGSETAGHNHQAAHLASQLAVMLRTNTWGLENVGAADFMQAEQDWTRPELDGFTVWKVEWTHAVFLGAEQWPWSDVDDPQYLDLNLPGGVDVELEVL